MSDPFVGEIRAFPYAFTPYGWMLCDGSILSVPQYPALYAVIGNTYGGTAPNTFQLPNLMGANGQSGLSMLGKGQGGGLSNYTLGAKTGTSAVALTDSQMPSHNHTVAAINAATTAMYSIPTNASHLSRYLAAPGVDNLYTDQALTAGNYLDNAALTPSGTAVPQAHNNMQPCLTFRFCIAVEGMFPSRP